MFPSVVTPALAVARITALRLRGDRLAGRTGWLAGAIMTLPFGIELARNFPPGSLSSRKQLVMQAIKSFDWLFSTTLYIIRVRVYRSGEHDWQWKGEYSR